MQSQPFLDEEGVQQFAHIEHYDRDVPCDDALYEYFDAGFTYTDIKTMVVCDMVFKQYIFKAAVMPEDKCGAIGRPLPAKKRQRLQHRHSGAIWAALR